MKASLVAVIVGSLLAGTNSASIGENVALRGRATQSSLYPHGFGIANNAIDGNQDTDFNHASCTHTNNDYSPWWRVDLLRPHTIHSIAITSRVCCSARLNGAEIRVGNSLLNNGNHNPKCGGISTIGPGETQTISCNGMVGRYVNIIIPYRLEYLTLCEVQVFADPAPM